MSIDEYFLRRQDKMRPKESRKSTKTSRPEATPSLFDFSPVEEEQQPLIANTRMCLTRFFVKLFRK